MSTSAEESNQATSAELSEADRAAWIRIERALRGMRWWMLFLATAMGLPGVLLLIGIVVGMVIEQFDDHSFDKRDFAFCFITVVFDIAMLLAAISFAQVFLAIRSARITGPETAVLHYIQLQSRAWFCLALLGTSLICLLLGLFATAWFPR